MFKFLGKKPREGQNPETGAEVIPLPQGLERAKAVLKTEEISDILLEFQKDPQKLRYLLDDIEFVTELYKNNNLFTDNEVRDLARWIRERARRLENKSLADRLMGLASHLENKSLQQDRKRAQFDIIRQEKIQEAMREDGVK